MPTATKGRAVELSDAQRLSWLRLIRSENVGPRTFRDLLNHFGSAENALAALPDLSRRGGRSSYKVCPADKAEAELDAVSRYGASMVALGERPYPPNLREIEAPPPLLTMAGPADTAGSKAVAIIGARNCSMAGAKLAATFAEELSRNGYLVVSGLARGIDSAAHKASLRLGTLAVFAGGINVIYPSENQALVEAFHQNAGGVVTEMPFGLKPRAREFPRRNRLISGISLGVLVIEAASRSGSLHTARFALEQNRDVLAVPGSPLDPRSEGANRLIQQGAALMMTPDDALQVLEANSASLLSQNFEEPAGAEHPGYNTEEISENDRQRLLYALGPTPSDVDEIIRFLHISPQAAQVMLLELELAGRLERHRGNKVSLIT
ncbi:DNA-processing protein DprA [Pseudovibrio exalbescens]|uniref:DNA-processing protein DprA n=1 Tax=Pseudovibrio exalbescens TaxID=197461 RepID=UPI002365EF2B|nr:DNA-processing protein DprA [Pseudovibrio exalbescens]MDD7910699.1 DNA-processing protein DprA [Pseudovibrio exalbescens]